jgi:hypothetical protein
MSLVACEHPPSAAIPPEQQPCLSEPAPAPAANVDSDWIMNAGWYTRSFYLKADKSLKWAQDIKARDDAGEYDRMSGWDTLAGVACGVAMVVPPARPVATPCGTAVAVDVAFKSFELGAAKKIVAQGGCLQLKIIGGKWDNPSVAIPVDVTTSKNPKFCLPS